MPYSFRKHTADIRMNVKGKTLEELFQDALLGMIKVMNPAWLREARAVKREIAVKAPDATALLVDFLNEALALAHTECEAYTAVQFRSLSECSLEAELEGYKTESFDEDIKAVTYHEADVKKNNKGEWETILIFDI